MLSPDSVVTFAKIPPSPECGQAYMVVGTQNGDEGKGKIVDLIARNENIAAVVRSNGGKNAGHQIVVEDGGEKKKLALHQIPSGITHHDKLNVIAHGVLLDPVELIMEMKDVQRVGLDVSPDVLAISGMAHVVLPRHKALDAARESGSKAQGSTKSGIAFVASDKSLREGLRVESFITKSRRELARIAYKGLRQEKTRRNALGLMRPTKRREARALADDFAHAAKQVVPYIKDTPALLNEILESGKDILIEGAQAYGLDIDHGKYPYTTSTGTTAPALIVGSGINPKYAGPAIGIVKATPSKVGHGSFVTREDDAVKAKAIRGPEGKIDSEYGATTGREREVGYLDLVLLKRAIMINGLDAIALTKFDCINRPGESTFVAYAYEKENADGTFERLETPPTCDEEIARCRPIYREFKTWTDNNSPEAQAYLEYVESQIGIPIKIVSYGPGRDEVLVR